jgi:hypothetical protein
VPTVSGNYAWNLDGEKAVPQPGRHLAGVPVAEFRQPDINLTPYGFLKAAQAANPTAISITLPRGGITWKGRATFLSFTVMGTERSTTRTCWSWFKPEGANPVYLDMLYELCCTEYKDFAGVKFPTVLHIHQGTRCGAAPTIHGDQDH